LYIEIRVCSLLSTLEFIPLTAQDGFHSSKEGLNSGKWMKLSEAQAPHSLKRSVTHNTMICINQERWENVDDTAALLLTEKSLKFFKILYFAFKIIISIITLTK
jgi:hypothetical protein